MKLDRIAKIKGHRIFRDFTWPTSGLDDFSRFNLIYGWNGAGKTTLSNLLRAIEKREAITEGDVQFVFDGAACAGDALASTPAPPKLRVFNRDYVNASVFRRDSDQVAPIFVLGEDSVEKQKEVEKLRAELADHQKNYLLAETAFNAATKSLENLCQGRARAIKDLIGNDASSIYRNYERSRFRQKAETLLAEGSASTLKVDDDARTKLIQRQQDKSKPKIPSVSLSLTDRVKLLNEVKEALKTSVISAVIDDLANRPNVAAWVEQGLHLHSTSDGSDRCDFCGQNIPPNRIEELKGHFNDKFVELNRRLNHLIETIERDKATLRAVRLPDAAALYTDLAESYKTAEVRLNRAVARREAELVELTETLNGKKRQPFEEIDFSPKAEGENSASDEGCETVADSVAALNQVLEKHNTETDAFDLSVAEARNKLESHEVAESLQEYADRTKALADAETERSKLSLLISSTSSQITAIEKEIAEHVRPAEELNQELRSYLGRDELQFHPEKTGYTITRSGIPAQNLSEGEKTAVAFLHFLKSLQGKDFQIENDVVVIDDPVSSLDANALYCAFGFMKERCKDAGQLFVLTHNFSFFQQVKDWFDNLRGPDKRKHQRYLLETRSSSTEGRTAEIKALDSLLNDYQSEYHFVFVRVYEEANNSNPVLDLASVYGMPNMARKLLESFLAFRQPGDTDTLHAKIGRTTGLDPALKARMYRFLQTHSHADRIGEPGHDLSILSETRDILRNLLLLMALEDKPHYEAMELLAKTKLGIA